MHYTYRQGYALIQYCENDTPHKNLHKLFNLSGCEKFKKKFSTEPCHQVYGKLCPRSVSVPRSGGHRSVAEGVAVFIGSHSRVKKMKQR